MIFKLLIILSVLSFSSCNQPFKAKFTADMRKFTGKFYNLSLPAEENYVFSPLSVYVTLGMVAAGAESDTDTQLKRAMSLCNYEEYRINNLMRKMFRHTKDEKYKLEVSNGMFAKEGFEANSSYVDILEQHYEAEIRKFNLKNGGQEGVANMINDWIADRTNNKIKDLVSPNSIDALTMMILLNAVFFKASWQVDDVKVKRDNFTLANGELVEVNFFCQRSETIKVFYDASNSMNFIALPYAVSDEKKNVYLVMGLPTNDNIGFTRFEEDLPNTLRRFSMNSFSSFYYSVITPEFKFDSKTDVKKVLIGMGVENLFDQQSCDLSGIADADLYVSDFTHKAFIDVNKKGTEAAAATAVFIAGRSFGSVPFVVDRPFWFGIYHEMPRIFSFMGKVVDPRQ